MINHFSQPVFFRSKPAFRKWLEEHHEQAKELLVGFYKVSSGRESISWSESVDEAICFGWIDGVRKSINEESYCIRFTPRKPGSTWSMINIRKAEELMRQGLMHPAGITAFSKRKENKSGIYSYEKDPVTLSKDFMKMFQSNKKAWKFFQSMPPSYVNPATHWVMTARQESTRLKRLQELISDSQEGRKIKRLNY